MMIRARIRRSERAYPRSERIAWRIANDPGPFHAAQVANISKTGIAITLPPGVSVPHGTAICTQSRRSASQLRARVVRVVQGRNDDHAHTTIGCHWISSRDRGVMIQSPRRTESFAQHL